MGARLTLLPPHEVIARWPLLRDILAPAVSEGHGELEVDDILKLATGGRMFVFALLDDEGAQLAGITVEFVDYPRHRAMVIGFGAGAGVARHAGHVAQVLREFAARAGAARLITYCKNPAMARFHERFFGGKRAYTVMEFDR